MSEYSALIQVSFHHLSLMTLGNSNVLASVDADLGNLINNNPPGFAPAIVDNHSFSISNGDYRQKNYSKRMEKNEEVARDNNPLVNLSYDILSANSYRIGPWNLQRHCLYLHLVFQCRLNLIPFYSRPQHRNWKFRAHASRQRADAMLINRMVGQCVDHDWDLVQSRLEPGGSRARRSWRRNNGIVPYDMSSRVLAWGLGAFSHTRPWAPVPRQVCRFPA